MKRIILSVLGLIVSFSVLIGCQANEVASLAFSNEEIVVLKGGEIANLKATPTFKNDKAGDLFDISPEMISGFEPNTTGRQKVKITYMGFDTTIDVVVADTIVTNATELRTAINNQADGKVIALKAGTYDLVRDDTRTYLGNTNFYFLITGNNTKWIGVGNVTVKSTVETPNGNLATQNFITVAGDNVTIDNIDIQSKIETNKVIEIYGKDCTISNLTIKPLTTTKFAGSIYLSTTTGTTTIDNVKLTYGRITTSGAKAGTKLTLKDVEIDSAGFASDDITEVAYWGFMNTPNITVTATNSKITVSSTLKNHADYNTFKNQLPSGLQIVEK